jgi:hypothetical protein
LRNDSSFYFKGVEMNSKTLLLGAALAGLGLVGTSCSSNTSSGAEAMGKCSGINSCKGKGACAGKSHGCAGMNKCKGKGWVKMSKDECEKKDGKFKA